MKTNIIEKDYLLVLGDYIQEETKSITIGWYDGIVNQIIYSNKLERWALLQLCSFNSNSMKKIYLLGFIIEEVGNYAYKCFGFDDEKKDNTDNAFEEFTNYINNHDFLFLVNEVLMIKTKTDIKNFDTTKMGNEELFISLLDIEDIIDNEIYLAKYSSLFNY